MAAEAHVGHIYPYLAEYGRYRRHRAVFVLIAYDESIEIAGKVHIYTVQLVDDYPAAAYGGGLHDKLLAVCARKLYHRSIRVRIPQRNSIYFIF